MDVMTKDVEEKLDSEDDIVIDVELELGEKVIDVNSDDEEEEGNASIDAELDEEVITVDPDDNEDGEEEEDIVDEEIADEEEEDKMVEEEDVDEEDIVDVTIDVELGVEVADVNSDDVELEEVLVVVETDNEERLEVEEL